MMKLPSGGDKLPPPTPFSWFCDKKCDSLLKFLNHQGDIDFEVLSQELVQVCMAMMKDNHVISYENIQNYIDNAARSADNSKYSYYKRVLLINLIVRIISECDKDRKVSFQHPAPTPELALPSAMSLLRILQNNVFDSNNQGITDMLEFVSFIVVERMIGKHKDGDGTACYDILAKYTADISATYLTRLRDMIHDNFVKRPPLSDKEFLSATLPKLASINCQLDKPFLLSIEARHLNQT